MRAALFAVVAIPCIALLLLAQAPEEAGMARGGVNFYSLEKERALGAQLAAEFRRNAKTVDEPGIHAYVLRLGSELAAKIPDSVHEFRFEVVSGDWTEPAAVPGGFLFVPLAALAAAKDESEFAGLLAHSLGHVALRHGTRTATRQQVVNLAGIPVLFMGVGGGLHADSQNRPPFVPLGFLKLQQRFEMQADRFGLELAARSGYDPRAFRSYVERTHPSDTERSPLPSRPARLEALEEGLSTLPAVDRTVSSEEFLRAQQTARALMADLRALDTKEPPTLRRR